MAKISSRIVFFNVFFVLFIVLGMLFINAQRIDSVDMIIKSKKTYAEKLESLKKLSENSADFQSSLQIINKTLAFSKKNKDLSAEGSLLRLKGKAYYFKGMYDSATFFLYKSMPLLQRKNSERELALLYNDLGKLYRKLKNFPRALENYNNALQIYEQLDDQEGIAMIYNESGVVYEYMKNYTEAIARYQKSLEIQRKRKDLEGQGYALEFIGGAYLVQKNTKLAEHFLLQALKIRQETKDEMATALNLNVLGNLYLETGDYTQAENYLRMSNNLAARLNYPDLMSQNYQQLAKVREKKGDYKSAYESFQKYKLFSDSLLNIGKLKQIEELSVKYETTQKDNEILAQKAKLFQRNAVVLGLLAVLVVGFGYYKNYRNRQKIKLQKEVLKQQDLATKAVIDAEDNERKRMAMHLHDGIGQLLTAANMNVNILQEYKDDEQNYETILNRTKSVLSEALVDVRTLAHQIMPNMLIKNSLGKAVRDLIEKSQSPKLKIELEIENLEEDLDQNIQVVVFRVIQESINNTIKHAQAKSIRIFIKQTPQLLHTVIKDDGIGFDPLKTAKGSDGMGLENIKSRIRFLKGNIRIESAPGKGTLIEVEIPLV